MKAYFLWVTITTSKITKKYSELEAIILKFFVSAILLLGGFNFQARVLAEPSQSSSLARLQISGYAAPGAVVNLYDGSTRAISDVAGSTGIFESNFTTRKPGVHQISLNFTDDHGDQSHTVTQGVSMQPQKINKQNVFLPPTMIRNYSASLSTGTPLKLSGYTMPRAVLSFFIDNKPVPIYARADTSGYYEVLVDTSLLQPGNHRIAAASTFAARTSSQSESAVFSLFPFGKPPVLSDFVKLPLYLGTPTITSPENGSVTSETTIWLKGTTTAGSQVTIYANGYVAGTVVAGIYGAWTYQYKSDATRNVAFSADTCRGSSCSLPSPPVTVVFSNLRPCDINFSLKNYRFWGVGQGEVITLQPTYVAKDVTIRVFWGDGTRLTAPHYPKADSTNFYKSYSSPGNYQGSVTITSKKCSESSNFSVEITRPSNVDSSKPKLKKLVITSISALVLLVGSQSVTYFRKKKL